MKVFLIIHLTIGYVTSAQADNIIVNTGALTLKSAGKMIGDSLSIQSILLPEICSTEREECRGEAVLTLYDGTLVPLQSGLHLYRSRIDGLKIGLKLNDENIRKLRLGEGGMVDLIINQDVGPYHTGEFHDEIFSYKYQGVASAEIQPRFTTVSISGSVNSGSCNIISGSHLNFNLQATSNELASSFSRDGKMFIERKDIEFDCVNVNSLSIKFSSGALKNNNPKFIFDSVTGVNLSLTYESSGIFGDVLWDGSPTIFPVMNDKVVIVFELFANKGSEAINPGKFFLTGVYTVDYH